MKTNLSKFIAPLLIGIALLGMSSVVHAVDPSDVPEVNLNSVPSQGGPFGAFKILQCDGPAGLDTEKAHLIKNSEGNLIRDPAWVQGENADGSKFIPCDFKGLMIQVQFLINAMLVIGVLAALLGSAFAGFLYITGSEKNISRAHKIFPKLAIGFVFMLTAWFIVYQILAWLTPEGSAYLQ